MKRLWIGILLLGAMLAGAIAMLLFSSHFYQTFSDTLDEAKTFANVENWESAAQKAHDAEALWDRHHRFLSAFTDHEPVEEIERLLAHLTLYEENRMRVDFVDVCQSLCLLCEAIDESHNLKWWSIL